MRVTKFASLLLLFPTSLISYGQVEPNSTPQSDQKVESQGDTKSESEVSGQGTTFSKPFDPGRITEIRGIGDPQLTRIFFKIVDPKVFSGVDDSIFYAENDPHAQAIIEDFRKFVDLIQAGPTEEKKVGNWHSAVINSKPIHFYFPDTVEAIKLVRSAPQSQKSSPDVKDNANLMFACRGAIILLENGRQTEMLQTYTSRMDEPDEVAILTCRAVEITQLLQPLGINASSLQDSDKITVRAPAAKIAAAKQVADFVNEVAFANQTEFLPGGWKELDTDFEFSYGIYRSKAYSTANLATLVSSTFPDIWMVTAVNDCVVVAGPKSEVEKSHEILEQLDQSSESIGGGVNSTQNLGQTASSGRLGSGAADSFGMMMGSASNPFASGVASVSTLQVQLESNEKLILSLLAATPIDLNRLKQEVETNFNLRQALQQIKLTELETKAAKLRDLMVAREQNRQVLIENRVKQLQNSRPPAPIQANRGATYDIRSMGSQPGPIGVSNPGASPNQTGVLYGSLSSPGTGNMLRTSSSGTSSMEGQSNSRSDSSLLQTTNNPISVAPSPEQIFLNLCQELFALKSNSSVDPNKKADHSRREQELVYLIDIALEGQSQKLKIAQLNVDEAQRELEFAEAEIHRMNILAEKGTVSTSEVEERKRRGQSAQSKMRLAHLDLSYLESQLIRMTKLSDAAKAGKPLFGTAPEETPAASDSDSASGSSLNPGQPK